MLRVLLFFLVAHEKTCCRTDAFMTVYLIFVQLFVVCLSFSLFTTVLLEGRCEEQCMPVIKPRVSQHQQRERKKLWCKQCTFQHRQSLRWKHIYRICLLIFSSLSYTHKHSTFFVLSNHFIKKVLWLQTPRILLARANISISNKIKS